MDLQAKKIQLIREVLRLRSEEIIDQAEKDSENNRLYNAREILNEIDTWK